MLLSSLHVSLPFLSVVGEFGSKIRDSACQSNHFYSHYSHKRDEHTRCITGTYTHDDTQRKAEYLAQTSHSRLEISYLFHYVEQNGRGHGDPWSLRQTGVHQQLNLCCLQSSWIFLHLSGRTRQTFETMVQGHSRCDANDTSKLHGYLLLATVKNWIEYIEYLYNKVRAIVSSNTT